MRKSLVTCCLAIGALQVVSSCGGGTSRGPTSPSSPPQSYTISSFISSVSAGTVTANLRAGSLPTPSAGPTASVTGNTSVINGGTAQTTITAGTPFSTVLLSVGAVTGGVGGYYEIDLGSPRTTVVLLISLATSMPSTSFDCIYAVRTPSGAVGPYSTLSARVVPAGTGDVQVNLSWDAASDVDLHVLDPRGQEIYYGSSTSASGGTLDLDSNAGCAIDGVNNENVRWKNGTAPSGTYTVRVDYWSGCSAAQTNYVVRVNNGLQTSNYTGGFTGFGDRGGAGAGRLITTFVHVGINSTTAPSDWAPRPLSFKKPGVTPPTR